jgi:hypothetical protein
MPNPEDKNEPHKLARLDDDSQPTRPHNLPEFVDDNETRDTDKTDTFSGLEDSTLAETELNRAKHGDTDKSPVNQFDLKGNFDLQTRGLVRPVGGSDEDVKRAIKVTKEQHAKDE